MQSTRLNQLQFLRTLAFCNIFLRHASQWNLFGYPDWNGSVSSITFFFMLSGFLTGYFFQPSRLQPGLSAYRKYMHRKIAKFYPLYLLVTLYAIAFSPVPQYVAVGYHNELITHIVQLFKHVLCIQPWFPEGYFSYYGPAWFSATLLFLTALNIPFCFLLKAIQRRSAKNGMLLCLLAVCYGGAFVYSYATRGGNLEFLHYIFPPARLGVYLGSVVLGTLIRPCAEKLRSLQNRTVLFTLLEAGALIFWFVSLLCPQAEWLKWNTAWILPNAIVLIVFSVGGGWLSRLFSCKPLVYIGGLTMECYFVHHLIILSYARNHQFDTTYQAGCLFSLAVCFALTYLIAFFLQRRSPKQA